MQSELKPRHKHGLTIEELLAHHALANFDLGSSQGRLSKEHKAILEQERNDSRRYILEMFEAARTSAPDTLLRGDVVRWHQNQLELLGDPEDDDPRAAHTCGMVEAHLHAISHFRHSPSPETASVGVVGEVKRDEAFYVLFGDGGMFPDSRKALIDESFDKLAICNYRIVHHAPKTITEPPKRLETDPNAAGRLQPSDPGSSLAIRLRNIAWACNQNEPPPLREMSEACSLAERALSGDPVSQEGHIGKEESAVYWKTRYALLKAKHRQPTVADPVSQDVEELVETKLRQLVDYCISYRGHAARKAAKAAICWKSFPSNECHLSHVLNLYDKAKRDELAGIEGSIAKEIVAAMPPVSCMGEEERVSPEIISKGTVMLDALRTIASLKKDYGDDVKDIRECAAIARAALNEVEKHSIIVRKP